MQQTPIWTASAILMGQSSLVITTTPSGVTSSLSSATSGTHGTLRVILVARVFARVRAKGLRSNAVGIMLDGWRFQEQLCHTDMTLVDASAANVSKHHVFRDAEEDRKREKDLCVEFETLARIPGQFVMVVSVDHVE